MSILKNYVEEKQGKKLVLILDLRTRWNSLCDMLERFISIENCVRKASLDADIDLYSAVRNDFPLFSAENSLPCLVLFSIGNSCKLRQAVLISQKSFNQPKKF
jgi:hypothetical protein